MKTYQKKAVAMWHDLTSVRLVSWGLQSLLVTSVSQQASAHGLWFVQCCVACQGFHEIFVVVRSPNFCSTGPLLFPGLITWQLQD